MKSKMYQFLPLQRNSPVICRLKEWFSKLSRRISSSLLDVFKSIVVIKQMVPQSSEEMRLTLQPSAPFVWKVQVLLCLGLCYLFHLHKGNELPTLSKPQGWSCRMQVLKLQKIGLYSVPGLLPKNATIAPDWSRIGAACGAWTTALRSRAA